MTADCPTGMRRYESAALAYRVLGAVRKRKTGRGERSAYLCRICLGYHLTAQPGRGRRFS